MGNVLSKKDLFKLLNYVPLYTINDLQTPGKAEVHWDNITNKEAYVNSFISLNDTPDTYTGFSGYKAVVKSSEDGIEFIPDTSGEDGREIELQTTSTEIQWRYVGDPSWTTLILLSELKGDQGDPGTNGSDGTDGREVEIQVNDTHIQWRYVGTSTWNDLIALSELKGDKGDSGIAGYSFWLFDSVPTSQGKVGDSGLLITNYDIYNYDSSLGWVVVGNIKGVAGNNGADGADGADGDRYSTTSTNSLDLDSLTVGSSLTITVESGLAYTIGQFVIIAYNDEGVLNTITGQVTEYSTDQLTIFIKNITGSGTYTSWGVNLAGIAESQSTPTWYEIDADAGTGTVSSRTYTQSYGWIVDSADQIATANLGSNPDDLIIKHNQGKNVIDIKIFRTTASTTTLLTGAAAYNRLTNDADKNAVELGAFATDVYDLKIYLTFEE